MKKKVTAILLAMAMTLSLCACGSSGSTGGSSQPSDSQTGGDVPNIGLLIPGGRGDMSICDALYNGVVAAQELCDFTFDYAEVINASDPEYFLREFADSGEYDLIIVACFTFFDSMSVIPEEYPDQKFLAWDMAEVPYDDNVIYGGFMHETTSFIAGAFTALLDAYGQVNIDGEEYTWTPTAKCAVLTNGDDPLDMRASVGYESGAKYVNPNFEVVRGYTGTYTDQAKAKELAMSMYSNDINFILTCSGSANYGIVEAAKELGGAKFALGFDQDTNDTDTHVICSALNDTSGALASLIASFVKDGVFNGGELKEFGYVTGNQSLALRDGLEIPAELQTTLDEIIQQVSSGELEVPANYDELAAFTATYQG